MAWHGTVGKAGININRWWRNERTGTGMDGGGDLEQRWHGVA